MYVLCFYGLNFNENSYRQISHDGFIIYKYFNEENIDGDNKYFLLNPDKN